MANSIQAAQAIVGSSRLPSTADFQPAPLRAAGAITAEQRPATFSSLSNALLAQSIPTQSLSAELKNSLAADGSDLLVPAPRMLVLGELVPGELLLPLRQGLFDFAQSALQELTRLAQVPQTPQSLAAAWRGPQGIVSLNDPALTRELAGLISRFSSTSSGVQGSTPLEPWQPRGIEQALAASAFGEPAAVIGALETLDASNAARAAQPQSPVALATPPPPRESGLGRSAEQPRQPARPLPPANRNETAGPKQQQKRPQSMAEKVLQSLAQLFRLGGQIVSRAFGY